MSEKKQKNETEFAALVGIDWADQKHAWALQVSGDITVERGELDHKPEAVDEWAAELSRRFADRGDLLYTS